MSDEEEEETSHTDVTVAPSLYTRPVYYRQTRKRGKILKTVSERYLRDDLGFGCHYCITTTTTDKEKRQQRFDNGRPVFIRTAQELLELMRPPHFLVICDTNVLLHNMDLLEQAHKDKNLMPNIVIPQTALQECRANRMVAYDRTVDLLRSSVGQCAILFPDPHHVQTAIDSANTNYASPNDENDARIRRVAAYYGQALRGTNAQVILLTDDAGMRQLATADGSSYQAMSVREWTAAHAVSLMDIVAHVVGTTPHSHEETTTHFAPHLEASVLSRGVQTGKYHRGIFRSLAKDSAMVTIRRGTERVAVTIQGSGDRNRAVDGDAVAVALHTLEQWISSAPAASQPQRSSTGIASDTAEPTLGELTNVPETVSVDKDHAHLRPTGKIVGIIRRNFENQSGSIFTKKQGVDATEQEEIATRFEREHADGTTTCVFFPVNRKIPPILLRTTQRDRLLGQRLVVSMDSWPATSPYPLGHYVRSIGPTGTKDVETQVLLYEHNIPHEPFPAAVLACLPPEDYKIGADDDSNKRLDLRHLPVLSIDPPGCKDIDDALHCIVLPNGNYQIGVHIADVTHYVKEGTAIDLEAANRSTSTYLVNKRLDMLPTLLTTDLCSLKANVDRYALLSNQ